jgi:hypothetical protein
MAVTRSPFVKKQTLDRPVGYGFDDLGRAIYTFKDGTSRLLRPQRDTSQDEQDFADVQNELEQNTYKAQSKALEVGKDSIADQLGNVAMGGAPKQVGSGWFKSLYDIATLPLNLASREKWLALGEVGKPIRSTLQSALNEVTDGITVLTGRTKIDARGNKVKPSITEFVTNARNFDFQIFGEGGTVGNADALPNKITNFFTNTLTDPLTYATLPASAASKAGKFATVLKGLQLQKKYPSLIDDVVLDNLGRKGPVAFPKEVLDAEGIFVGIKYMGKEVPNSSVLAEIWADTAGAVSAKAGDIFFRKYPKAQAFISSPKTKPLVLAGLGRRHLSGKEWYDTYVQGLAHYSANTIGKGSALYAKGVISGEITNTAMAVKGLPDDEQKLLVSLIEDRSGAVTNNPLAQEIVESFKKWDGAQRDVINAKANELSVKYGINVKEMGFVEDHIYHSVTDEAKEFLRSQGKSRPKGDAKYVKYFADYKLTADEIKTGRGISSYRKVRGPELDPVTGVTEYSEFLGQKVLKGDISEINEIAMKELGIPWFKTDLPTIIDDSIASYGRMHGRYAYVERLLDFGPEVIKPLVKKAVDDGPIADTLYKIVADLTAEAARLTPRVKRNVAAGLAGTREGLATELQEVSDVARAVLAGKTSYRKAVNDETLKVVSSIDAIIQRMQELAEQAVKVSPDKKGEFNNLYLATMRHAAEMKEALLSGEGDRFLSMQELRYEYVSRFPNNDDWKGKSAEWMAERIVRDAGGGDAIDAREVFRQKTHDALIQMRDQIPAGDPQAARVIDEAILANETELEALARINVAKDNASYATEGLVYGFPPSFSDEPIPFQLYTTKPIDNEFGTFAQMKDAIVGHAIPEQDLLDLRDPTTFANFLNPEFWADDLNRAWAEVGVPDMMPMDVVDNMLANNGFIDPDFIRAYPEKAEWLMGMYDMQTKVDTLLETADDVLPMSNEELNDFFTWFVDMQERLAGSLSPNNAESVGKVVANKWFGGVVDDAAANGYKGALMPLTRIFDDFEPSLNEWAVLLPSNTPAFKVGDSIASPWQLLENNGFMKTIMDETLEATHVAKTDVKKLLQQNGIEAGQTLAERAKLDEQILESTKVDNAFKALMNLRSTDSVQIGGKSVPKTVILNKLATLDSFFNDAYSKIDRDILREIEKTFGPEELQTLRLDYKQRLPMLLNEAKVLETWTDEVGSVLEQEVNDFLLLLANKPPKGSTAASNAAWSKHVEKSLESSEMLRDLPAVKEAYDRVTKILHADELALAKIESEIPQAFSFYSAAKMLGIRGQKFEEVAEFGWEELAGLGLQIPKEAKEQWMPAIKKLSDAGEYGAFLRNFDKMNAYWKRWVTASIGFFVRNGMSATFMNYADGVTNDAIATGIRWASAQNDTVGKRLNNKNFANWMKRAGITDPQEMAKAEWATKVVMATGHGVNDDFAAPTIGRLAQVTTDKYIGFFQNKNSYVERAVRLPMAIDSFNKGHTFDEAVARISRIHFDYSDLSRLDEVAKRIIPFWIWTSRNIPLQMTQILTRPKAYYEYQRVQEQFPVNANLMMPQWINEREPLGLGNGLANWVLTPDLPHIRMKAMFEGFANPQQALGQTGLAIRLPAELITGKKFGTFVQDFNAYGRKKEVKGPYETLIAKALNKFVNDGQISTDKYGNLVMDEKVTHVVESIFPIIAQINRLTGGATGGKEALEERMLSSILNYLGIPGREIGPVQQKQEAQRQNREMEDLLKQLKQYGYEQGIGITEEP